MMASRSRSSVSSLVASSISGTGMPQSGDDYTFGFSLTGVGMRQQSRRRHSLRPDTSLPFDKQPLDQKELISEMKNKFVPIPTDAFPGRHDKEMKRSMLTLDGDRYFRDQYYKLNLP